MDMKEKYLAGKYNDLMAKGKPASANAIVHDLAAERLRKAGGKNNEYYKYIEETRTELEKVKESKETKKAYKMGAFILKTWHIIKILAIILLLPFILFLFVIKALAEMGASEIKKDSKQDNL